MNRRSFLRGSILSLAGTTAAIQLASVEEMKMLTAAEPVAIGNLDTLHHPGVHFAQSPQVFMRSAHKGIFICVGIMTQVNTHVDVVDVVTWDGKVELIPGLKRGELLFEGQEHV